MEYTHLLLRPGEIFLKGKNHHLFEDKLVGNLKRIIEVKSVKKLRGRFVIKYFSEHNNLKRIFGLVSYSPAVRVEKDVESIKLGVLKYFKNKKIKFKVETKRSDKNFPIKSPDFNVLIGKYIEENSKAEFSFKDYENKLNIEINQEGAYLFLEVVKCFGGLPTGVEGRVLLLVETEKDLLAGLLMMKRGVDVIPVAFSEKDISLLQRFSPDKLKLEIVKDLEEFASSKKISVLVSGQTFVEYEMISGLLVLRPLIGYNKKEIEEMLKEFSRSFSF